MLHDSLNPTQELLIDADAVVTVTPLPSGSSVQFAHGPTRAAVTVHETPGEVLRLLEPATP